MPDEVVDQPQRGNQRQERNADPTGSEDEPPVIHVGCAGLPPGLRRVRYFERLTYLEVEGTAHKLPKAKVLRRWMQASPKARFGLVAPQVITHKPGPRGYPRGSDNLSADELAQAGGYRATEIVRRAVAELIEAIQILRTDVVVFRAPADFTPSAANRETLRKFFTELAPQESFGNTVRVWEPGGLWEPEPAAQLAAELGLVYACDPLSNDPLGAGLEFFAGLPHSTAYFRLTGMGRVEQRFDNFAMESVIEAANAYRQVWVVFANIGKYPNALQFQRRVTG